MRTIVLAAAACFALLLPGAAFADEYNFTVPVRVLNAEHISAARVNCSVSFREGASFVPEHGSTLITMVDGAFSGNVAVRVTTLRPRANQTRWSCSLSLFYEGGLPAPNTGPAGVAEWYRTRSGRTVQSQTLLVQGLRLP